ncbi:hypothetical protein [Listeria seeligeri]|uniref:hypothetical protein n=1 Tax=Listeria seeligeri TaxID=1640 RepID=UPI0022EBC5FC|nr:hypothetical protein [Listeria seeligeri]
MKISNKLISFINVFVWPLIYVENVIDFFRLGKRGKSLVKNIVALAVCGFFLMIIFGFFYLLFGVDIKFIYYLLLFMFSFSSIFFVIRRKESYNLLKILSCYFLHLNYRWKTFEKENLPKLLINPLLVLFWGFFVHWLTKKAFLSVSIINQEIIELTSLVLIITTLYTIYVHFPHREKTRKFRKKGINLLVMIGANVVLSFNTYYAVQKTMTINEITFSVLSWMIAIALLLFTIIDFLSYSIINYEIPYYILRDYAVKKKIARKKQKRFWESLKVEIVQGTKIPETIEFSFYDLDWFFRKNNLTLKSFILNVLVAFFTSLSILFIVKKGIIEEGIFTIIEGIIFPVLKYIAPFIFIIYIIYRLILGLIIYILNNYRNKDLRIWLEVIQIFLLVIPIIMFLVVGMFNLININLRGWIELSAIIFGIGALFSFSHMLIRYIRANFFD